MPAFRLLTMICNVGPNWILPNKMPMTNNAKLLSNSNRIGPYSIIRQSDAFVSLLSGTGMLGADTDCVFGA